MLEILSCKNTALLIPYQDVTHVRTKLSIFRLKIRAVSVGVLLLCEKRLLVSDGRRPAVVPLMGRVGPISEICADLAILSRTFVHEHPRVKDDVPIREPSPSRLPLWLWGVVVEIKSNIA